MSRDLGEAGVPFRFQDTVEMFTEEVRRVYRILMA